MPWACHNSPAVCRPPARLTPLCGAANGGAVQPGSALVFGRPRCRGPLTRPWLARRAPLVARPRPLGAEMKRVDSGKEGRENSSEHQGSIIVDTQRSCLTSQGVPKKRPRCRAGPSRNELNKVGNRDQEDRRMSREEISKESNERSHRFKLPFRVPSIILGVGGILTLLIKFYSLSIAFSLLSTLLALVIIMYVRYFPPHITSGKQKASKDQSPESALSRQATTAVAALARHKSNERIASIWLISAALILNILLSMLTEQPPSLLVLAALALGGVVLIGADLAFKYRVRRGLFGTSEYEARQILQFIVENSDQYDFSDGLGISEWSPEQAPQELRDLVESWATS